MKLFALYLSSRDSTVYSTSRVGLAIAKLLARRVTWRLTEATGPAADAPGRVRITLADGTVVEGEVARSGGGPDQPLTFEQVLGKAVENAGERAAHVADLVARLDELDGVDAVLAATHS